MPAERDRAAGLPAGPLALQPRPYADPLVQDLVAQVQAEYVLRYGGHDRTPVEPAEFSPPQGLFLVGWLDGTAIACGGWRVHDQPVAGRAAVEIKRMYVAATARRRGLGRVVLAELERTAAVAGHGYAVLNTGTAQPEAIALYRACGYHDIPGFGIYRDSPTARFFGKALI
jgi:GNAT superfamily N-acetyltransferase